MIIFGLTAALLQGRCLTITFVVRNKVMKPWREMEKALDQGHPGVRRCTRVTLLSFLPTSITFLLLPNQLFIHQLLHC